MDASFGTPSPARIVSRTDYILDAAWPGKRSSKLVKDKDEVQNNVRREIDAIQDLNIEFVLAVRECRTFTFGDLLKLLKSAKSLQEHVLQMSNKLTFNYEQTTRRKRWPQRKPSYLERTVFDENKRSLELLNVYLQEIIRKFDIAQKAFHHTQTQIDASIPITSVVDIVEDHPGGPLSQAVTLHEQDTDQRQLTSMVNDEAQTSPMKTPQVQLQPPYPHSERHKQYREARIKDTCKWIFESKEYLDWLDTKKSDGAILWCHGKPGTGKSVLASAVVDHLIQRADYNVIYHYLGQDAVLSCGRVGVCLLQQLELLAGKARELTRYQSLEQDLELTMKAIANHTLLTTGPYLTKPVVVVLDAWEFAYMGDPEDYRQLLASLISKGIRIMLTSRSDVDCFLTAESRSCCRQIILPCSSSMTDIEVFARSLIDGRNDTPAFELLQQGNEIITQIVRHVSKESKGSFSKTRLLVEMLLQHTTRYDLYEAVKNLEAESKNWKKILASSVSNQTPTLRRLSGATLLWLSQVKRPMTVSALLEALAFAELPTNNSDRRLPGKDQLPDPTVLRVGLKNVLTFDAESNTVALADGDMFRALQKDHGLLKGLDQNRLYSLSDVCIAYLSSKDLADLDYRDRSDIERYSQTHPFLLYAARTWREHARSADIRYGRAMHKHEELLHNQRRLHTALAVEAWADRMRWNENEWQQQIQEIENTTVANAIIDCDDDECLEELLNADSKEVEQDRLRPLLLYAFNRGRDKCFDMIYSRLLDISLAQQEGSPVSAHVVHEDAAKVEEILAWFDQRRGHAYCSTDVERLSLAINGDDELRFRSALHRIIDINVKDEWGVYPIHRAVMKGSMMMVQTLLERGANPSKTSTFTVKKEQIPLHEAARGGDVDMVKLLLSYKADVNQTAADGRTALFPAIDCAHEHGSTAGILEIIKILLRKRVDIDAHRHGDVSALQDAARNCLPRVVELLLQYGADPIRAAEMHSREDCTQCSSKEACLEIAAMLEGRREVVKKLRSRRTNTFESQRSQTSTNSSASQR